MHVGVFALLCRAWRRLTRGRRRSRQRSEKVQDSVLRTVLSKWRELAKILKDQRLMVLTRWLKYRVKAMTPVFKRLYVQDAVPVRVAIA
jgi:hypothetical protein